MSKELHKYGSVLFDLAASDKLAIYSQEPVKVYTRVADAHKQTKWGLLATTTAGIEYLSAAVTVLTEVKLVTGPAKALYSAGTDAGILERRGLRGQGAPVALDATGALTAAAMRGGIITSATTLATTGTMITGALMDDAFDMEIGESFDWSVIVTGGTNSFTVSGATGHTVVGAAAVVKSSTGVFRTRKTAADTFITYRVG